MNSNETMSQPKPINILLVDDDDGDVILTRKALERGKIYNSVSVASDGVEAMKFLKKEGEFVDAPRPDLILLDLNMPRKDGRETLAEIKNDPDLRSIPVVILTTSEADPDVLRSYDMHANCFVTKPVDLNQFTSVVQSLQNFWFCVVQLPPTN